MITCQKGGHFQWHLHGSHTVFLSSKRQIGALRMFQHTTGNSPTLISQTSSRFPEYQYGIHIGNQGSFRWQWCHHHVSETGTLSLCCAHLSHHHSAAFVSCPFPQCTLFSLPHFSTTDLWGRLAWVRLTGPRLPSNLHDRVGIWTQAS